MFAFLHALIFESTPVRFESRYSLAESLQRLESQLESTAHFSERAEGQVSAQHVQIRRQGSDDQNSFRPVFIGRFGMENGKVFLEGEYGLPMGTRRTVAFLFGALACVAGAGLAAILWGDLPVPAFVIPLVVVLLLLLSLWSGRTAGIVDESSISELIRRAICR